MLIIYSDGKIPGSEISLQNGLTHFGRHQTSILRVKRPGLQFAHSFPTSAKVKTPFIRLSVTQTDYFI